MDDDDDDGSVGERGREAAAAGGGSGSGSGSVLRAVHVACGSAHSLCITESGEVYVWGRGKSGRLGLGSSTRDRHLPVLVRCVLCLSVSLSLFLCVALFVSFCLFLSLFVSFCLFLCLFVSFCLFLSLVVAVLILTAPLLFLFSFSMCVCMFLFSSLFAQLTPTSSSYGRQGGWGDSGRCVWVDGGWSHSLAVTECGHAYSWGCGADGRLGIGCYSDQLVPAYVRLYGNEQRRRRDDGGGGGGGVREYDGGRMEEEEEDLAYCLTEIEPCMDHEDDPVVRVAAGYAHSTFLTRAGLLYTAVRWVVLFCWFCWSVVYSSLVFVSCMFSLNVLFHLLLFFFPLISYSVYRVVVYLVNLHVLKLWQMMKMERLNNQRRVLKQSQRITVQPQQQRQQQREKEREKELELIIVLFLWLCL